MHIEKCSHCCGTGIPTFDVTYKKEICKECNGSGQVVVSVSSKYPKGYPSELIPIRVRI